MRVIILAEVNPFLVLEIPLYLLGKESFGQVGVKERMNFNGDFRLALLVYEKINDVLDTLLDEDGRLDFAGAVAYRLATQ